MKWTLYWIVLPLIAAGALVAGSMASSTSTSAPGSGASPESGQTEPPSREAEEDEDFIPTEEVPADSAISFPVDI